MNCKEFIMILKEVSSCSELQECPDTYVVLGQKYHGPNKKFSKEIQTNKQINTHTTIEIL